MQNFTTLIFIFSFCLPTDLLAQEKQAIQTQQLARSHSLSQDPLLKYIGSHLKGSVSPLESNDVGTYSSTTLKDEQGHIIMYNDHVTTMYSFPSRKRLVKFRGPSKERCHKDAAESFVVASAGHDTATTNTVDFLSASSHTPPLSFSYASLSKFGNRLLICSHDKKRIMFWNPHTGDKIFDFTLGTPSSSIPQDLIENGLRLVEFDHTGSRILLLSSHDNLACIDLPAGQMLTKMDTVKHARINALGTRLLIAKEAEILLWDLDKSRLIQRIAHPVDLCRFSSQGTRLVTSDGKKIYFWDAQTGVLLLNESMSHFGNDGKDIKFIEYSPSGDVLVIAFIDKAPQVFDIQKGVLLCTLPEFCTTADRAFFGTKEDQFIILINGDAYLCDIGTSQRLLKAFSAKDTFTLPQRIILDLLAKIILLEDSGTFTHSTLDLKMKKDLQQADYEALLEMQVKENICTENDRVELFRVLDRFVLKEPQSVFQANNSAPAVRSAESSSASALYSSPVRFRPGVITGTIATTSPLISLNKSE